VGESGAGKTRLLNEFLNQAEADGDLVIQTRPDPYWAEVAFSSLREAVHDLTGLSEQTLPHADLGSATVEARRGLDEIFSGRPAPGDRRSPMERRHAIAEALRWAIERCAALNDGRVVIAVDEYHRVDPPSQQAIADVLADPPECSLLVVAAHVPHFEPQWGPEHTARVLPGLSAVSIPQLLRNPGSSDRVRAIQTDGRGILPMYVEQVIRYTDEVGGEPPARLADLLAARFDVLEQNARQVLQALAVLGDRVEIRVLAKQLPKTLELEPILDTLERAGFVARSEQVVSTGHPLIRELVMLGIPAAVRRDLHAKALKTWEKRGSPIEARAIHAYYAEESFSALLLLEQVAERAGARGDLATEVLALRRGLELARLEISRGELDDPLQAMLIFGRKLGSALTRSGLYSDAEGVLREVLDIAGPSSPDRARVLGALAQVAHGRQREREALGYIDQAIEAARQSGARELLLTLEDTRSVWAS
jgi:serine/threonine-protein kinase